MIAFGVLGPITIVRGREPVVIGAAKLRCLLAVLLCRAGHPVSTDALIEALWGADAPPGARKALQVYVHRLRAAVGEDQRIGHGGAGYALAVQPGELDAHRFADLAGRGRDARQRGDPDGASKLLAQALHLWRGPAYADVDGAGPILAEEVRRLEEQRLHANEERIAADLDRGRHAELVPELVALTDTHPYRERLRAYLMLALYRAGRTAEALETFARTRSLLVDQLGVEPGTPLHRLHEAILRDAEVLARLASDGIDRLGDGGRAEVPAAEPPRASAPTAPHQLPPNIRGFVGRAEQIGELDGMLADWSGNPATLVAVISGMPGVGKTALAVHWAHRVARHFPGGQLHADLRGYASGRPARPIDALTLFLRALGVPDEKVPADEDEAVGLYRSVLDGRRVLLVLDNARTADQVRPLLPGSSGCLTLVTSRDRLTGLIARDGARAVPLDTLPPADSVALLADVLGPLARFDAAGVAALAEACGYLPLALRIAAANVAGRSAQDLARYAAALRADTGLRGLEVGGDARASVRAAFTLSYRALPQEARRVFRLLSVLPGPDLTPDVVAALADMAPERAAALLRSLVSAHLLSRVHADRYTLHDLVRLHAREQLDRRRDRDEGAQAFGRVCDFYLRSIAAAAAKLYPQMVRIPGPAPDPAARSLAFTDETAALSWLDAELPNLIATVHHAGTRAPVRMCWLLADALRGYFWIRRQVAQWLATGQDGLRAATSCGDPWGIAAMHLSLGLAYFGLTRYRDAVAHFDAALAAGQTINWREAQASALNNLGTSHAELGNARRAVEYLDEALSLNRVMGRRVGEGVVLGNVGMLRSYLGDLVRSAEDMTAAIALYQEADSPAGEAVLVVDLGVIFTLLGQLDRAHEHLTRGLAMCERIGYRYGQVIGLCGLARFSRETGRPGEAHRHAAAALSLARLTGDRCNEAAALIELGAAVRLLGDNTLALRHAAEALAIAQTAASPHYEVGALIELAESNRLAGALDEASRCADQAISLAGERGYRILEGEALTAVAAIALARASHDEAVKAAEAAVARHRETGSRLCEGTALIVLARAQRQAFGPAVALPTWHAANELYAAIGAPAPAPEAAADSENIMDDNQPMRAAFHGSQSNANTTT